MRQRLYPLPTQGPDRTEPNKAIQTPVHVRIQSYIYNVNATAGADARRQVNENFYGVIEIMASRTRA